MSNAGNATDGLVARYDAGLLGDGGGGDVGWWQDYIRAELERAHEFYSDQHEALQRSNAEKDEALAYAESILTAVISAGVGKALNRVRKVLSHSSEGGK